MSMVLMLASARSATAFRSEKSCCAIAILYPLVFGGKTPPRRACYLSDRPPMNASHLEVKKVSCLQAYAYPEDWLH
ncbi:hypothetical protein HZS_7473 [Henneguya salminicola]|nr:hypothetical protein HZS_7473 [Henneguya salminicola]